MNLQRTPTLPDQSSLRARRREDTTRDFESVPFDTLDSVIRTGALNDYTATKLRTIQIDLLERLTLNAMRSMEFDDSARWRSVLGAAHILFPVFWFVFRHHTELYTALVAREQCTTRLTCGGTSDWRAQRVKSGRSALVRVFAPDATTSTTLAAVAEERGWSSLDAVKEWWSEHRVRDVTVADGFPPPLGCGLTMVFDDGASYGALVTKGIRTSTAWLYNLVVFKNEGPEAWERLYLDPSAEGEGWRVVWTPPEAEAEAAEDPSPFTRTPTTVRLEALCFAYETTDLFRSWSPWAVIADITRASAGLGRFGAPQPIALVLNERTRHDPATVLSLYDLMRALVFKGGGAVLMQDARCVYLRVERADGATLRLFEREAERVYAVMERNVVGLVRFGCEYLRHLLLTTQPLGACVSVDAAAVIAEPCFHQFWSQRLPAYQLLHAAVSTCEACGYAFKADVCSMCGGQGPPSDTDEGAARHRCAAKVHLGCAQLTPAYDPRGEPLLRCDACGVTEPAVPWMGPGQRRRLALERFVPSGLERPQRWYCLACNETTGRFVLVPALNVACPECGAFGQ